MAGRPEFLLLAAIRHFGWGGLGKLRLILDNLPHIRVALHGGPRITAVTRELLGPRHTFSDDPPERADVALVINDSGAANEIAALDVPVVYVDSLPYTRQTDSEIPVLDRLACYCAQKYPIELLPLANPSLQKWQATQWIDPIVPAPQRRRGGSGIVVNLGGLHTYDMTGVDSALVDRSVAGYLKLVLFPLVELLRASGRKVFAVCGNLGSEECRWLRELLPECEVIGPQTPYGFERLLMDADLLVTSPGNTTILHAVAIDLPTLLLPPQNFSQILHGRIYAKPNADIMRWPASIVDVAKVEELRRRGLKTVLDYIYPSIAEASASPDIAVEVRNIVRSALDDAPADGVLNPDLARLGFAGASQVAELIRRTAS